MENAWAWVSAALGAIVLIGNAAEKITAAVKIARAPENTQNSRIESLEQDVKEIKQKLGEDKRRLDDSEKANHVSLQALLALLEHGLNGNNIDQMDTARKDLQNYLINH